MNPHVIAGFKTLFGKVEIIPTPHFCYGLQYFEVDGINILVGNADEIKIAFGLSEKEVEGTDIEPIMHRMLKIDLGNGLTGYTWDIPMKRV